MGPTITMAKLEGARQAAQIPLLTGKSFTIAKVTTGNGMGNMLFLSPTGAGSSPGAMVALKLQNGNQAAAMKGMVGKSVTVMQSPIGARRLLVMKTNPAVAAKAATAGKGAAAAKGMAASKGAIGGKVMIGGKSAVAGQWLVAQPSLIVNPGSGIAMQGFALTPPMAQPVAMTVKAGAGKAAVGKAAVGGKVATVAAGKVAAGQAVAGKSIVGGLGLGLGLGALGPLLVLGSVGLVGAGAYQYVRAKRRQAALVEETA